MSLTTHNHRMPKEKTQSTPKVEADRKYDFYFKMVAVVKSGSRQDYKKEF